MRSVKAVGSIVVMTSLSVCACQGPAQHAAAMAEARRLRGPTAYDGQPAFGEPYDDGQREKPASRRPD
jgi:hypothetical protein